MFVANFVDSCKIGNIMIQSFFNNNMFIIPLSMKMSLDIVFRIQLDMICPHLAIQDAYGFSSFFP